QARVASELGFGVLKLRSVLRDGGFGSPQVVLVRIALDGEEWLALLDQLPILEQHPLEIPRNAGDELHRVDGLSVPGELEIVGHRLMERLGDRHLWGRRRLGLRLLSAARQVRGESGYRDPTRDASGSAKAMRSAAARIVTLNGGRKSPVLPAS